MTADRVARFLHPQSIALVGASEHGMYPAGILEALRRYGYAGRIYPVNPRRTSVFDLPCWPNLAALPERPDLVVITVPRQAVISVIDDCLALDLKAALIITAGFREGDAEGVALEMKMRALIQGSDLAVIGPNCAGIANLVDGIVVTRLPTPPLAGNVGFVSASGALMMALQGTFADLNLGLSHLLSLGNQMDVTLTEALAFMVADPDTAVIGAFVEGIVDGREFLRVAEAARLAGKPLVLVKSGRTQMGQLAAATHTAALASSDRIFQSACAQASVVVVDDMEELARTLYLFSAWTERWPLGSRLALVTQSGGMGSLTADLATMAGFELPALSSGLQQRLRGLPHLLAFDGFGNPTDVRGAGAAGEEVGLTLKPFLEDPAFDVVILLLAKAAVEAREVETARSLAALAATAGKPFCVVWVGQRIPRTEEHTDQPLAILAEARVPVFVQPGDCIKALVHVVTWQARRAEASNQSAPVANAEIRGSEPPPRFLNYDEIGTLLRTYGIDLVPAHVVANREAALAAAAVLGYPVAVKGLSPALTHKSDAGLVRLDVGDSTALHIFVDALLSGPLRAPDDRILIQQMARPGIEVLVGVENDPAFGPAVVCGPGGLLVELLDDTALALAPLELPQAMALIQATRLGRMLDGLRGQAPGDRRALAALLVCISRFAIDRSSQLVSMDLNPVIVHEQGLSIVDVRLQWQGKV